MGKGGDVDSFNRVWGVLFTLKRVRWGGFHNWALEIQRANSATDLSLTLKRGVYEWGIQKFYWFLLYRY